MKLSRRKVNPRKKNTFNFGADLNKETNPEISI